METIFEFIWSILLDIGLYIIDSNKMPFWLRCVCMFLFISLFGGMFIGFIYIGIQLYQSHDRKGSIVLIFCSLLLLVMTVKICRDVYKTVKLKRKENVKTEL